jgi:N-acetylneuraminic acid mutarotase
MYDLWVKFLKQNKLCEDYHFSDSLLLFDEHAWQWGNENLQRKLQMCFPFSVYNFSVVITYECFIGLRICLAH